MLCCFALLNRIAAARLRVVLCVPFECPHAKDREVFVVVVRTPRSSTRVWSDKHLTIRKE
jgi:hypothetical protein